MEALGIGVKMRNVLVPQYISVGLTGENSELELWICTSQQAFSACVDGEIVCFKASNTQRYYRGQLLKVFKKVHLTEKEDSQALYPRVFLAGFWRLQLE